MRSTRRWRGRDGLASRGARGPRVAFRALEIPPPRRPRTWRHRVFIGAALGCALAIYVVGVIAGGWSW